MQLIKFCGKNKKDSVKRAISFFYDNCEENLSLEEFLAKCRLQMDKKTVYFYPEMEIDIEKFRELKRKQRDRNKK